MTTASAMGKKPTSIGVKNEAAYVPVIFYFPIFNYNTNKMDITANSAFVYHL